MLFTFTISPIFEQFVKTQLSQSLELSWSFSVTTIFLSDCLGLFYDGVDDDDDDGDDDMVMT